MIGVGTPTARPRRTTLPCSASTSMRLPCDEIDEQRRTRARWQLRRVLLDARFLIVGQPDAVRAADPRHFFNRVDEQRPAVVVGPDRPDGQPRRAGECRKRRQIGELLPDRLTRIGDRPRRGCRRRPSPRSIARTRSVTRPACDEILAEHHTPMGAGLPNQTGPFDRRRDVGRAADRRVLADNRGHFLGAVDAVLQRQHRRLGSHAAAGSAESPWRCRRS